MSSKKSLNPDGVAKSPLSSVAGFVLVTCIALLVLSGTALAAPGKTKLVEKRYSIAKSLYNHLNFGTGTSGNRASWNRCARLFEQAYKTDPYSKKAPASLLTLGHIYSKQYHLFKDAGALNDALAYYDDVVTFFPTHSFADDALYQSAKIYAKELGDLQNAALVFAKLIAMYPRGDMLKTAAKDLQDLKESPLYQKLKQERAQIPEITPEDFKTAIAKVIDTPQSTPMPPAHVTKLRHWSTKSYTRVVIETDIPVHFEDNLLKKDGDKPRRLYVNLRNSRISPDLQKNIPIQDGLLQRVRSAQYSSDTVRVVLDTQSVAGYKIFSLPDPARIVIDVKGTELPTLVQTKAQALPNAPSLAQQLGLAIKRIIIDPGHGGKDPGAVGAFGLREKDIVLKVAKKLGRILNSRYQSEVIFTRKHDTFIPLEERTAIANTQEGDLFISIHANAAHSKSAKGVETYYLDLAVTEDAMQVAARENAASARTISDMQSILTDLIQNSKKKESEKLAQTVHQTVVKGLKRKYRHVDDHGVKKAPFIVLIGAQMPAILAEIAFISNEDEARRLQDESYLEALAEEIASGIAQYAKTLNMASL